MKVLCSLRRQVELFEQVLHDIVQEVEHECIVQVNHFVGEVEAASDERVRKHLLLLPQFQVYPVDLLLTVSQEKHVASVSLINGQFLG